MKMRRLDLRLLGPTLLGATLALVLGCGADESLSDVGYMDEDTFPGNCAGSGTDGCDTDGTGVATTTASDTTGAESGCRGSEDCMGGYCAADFDPDRAQADEPQCRFTCLPLLDEASWCVDDTSCCDPDAICTVRGYCLLPEDATTTADPATGAETTGSTGGDGSSTGTTDGSGTGTGSTG